MEIVSASGQVTIRQIPPWRTSAGWNHKPDAMAPEKVPTSMPMAPIRTTNIVDVT